MVIIIKLRLKIRTWKKITNREIISRILIRTVVKFIAERSVSRERAYSGRRKPLGEAYGHDVIKKQ